MAQPAGLASPDIEIIAPAKKPKVVQGLIGGFFKRISELTAAEKAENAAVLQRRAISEAAQLDEDRRRAVERAEEAARTKKLPGRPPKPKGLVPMRAAHELIPIPKPTCRLGATRKNWLGHPQLAGMIFREVESRKSYREAVRALQQTHSVSGLFNGLEESTVRGWYMESLVTGKGGFTTLTPRAMAALQRGSSFYRPAGSGSRASLSGDGLQPAKEEMLEQLRTLRKLGVVFSSVTVRNVVKAVLLVRAPQVLAENGGPFRISVHWLMDFVQKELRWVTRVVCGDTQHLPADWKAQVEDMCLRVAFISMAHNITPEFFYSMDETFVWFVPLGGARTLAEEGSKEVKATGGEDKRGCTMSLTIKADGSVCRIQLIYGGKTPNCLPGFKPKNASDAWQPLPAREEADAGGHLLSFSKSHWQTDETMKEHFEQVIIKDYTETCTRLGKEYGVQKLIYHIDVYSVHIAEAFRSWLKNNYPFSQLCYSPPSCTPEANPGDTYCNRPLKHFVKGKYVDWTVEQLTTQMRAGVPPTEIKLRLGLPPLPCPCVSCRIRWSSLP